MEARKMTDKSHALRQTPWNPKQLMALEKLRDNLTDKDNK